MHTDDICLEDRHDDGKAAAALGIVDECSLKGRWIAPANSAAEKNFHFRVRKKFLLTEVPRQATLQVGCESYYLVYLNGHEIGRGPARGTHTVNFFDEYLISEFLQPGENTIAALCLCMNIETFIAAPAEPAFFADMAGVITTNESWETLGPGEEWRRATPLESEQTGFSEWRDLRHEPVGWTLGLDSGNWQPARCIEDSSKVLKKEFRAREIPLLQETEVSPLRILAQALVSELMKCESEEAASLVMKETHEKGAPELELYDEHTRWRREAITKAGATTGLWSGAYIFDFGKIIVGRVEFDLMGEEGAVVDLAYAEEITDGRLMVQHCDPHGGQYNFADRYILRSGWQRIGTCLSERGFRYLQTTFRNFNDLPELHRLKAVDRRYPYGPSAVFSCNDSELETVWKSCVQTISTCTTDTFIDCPWRERAMWVNDLVVESTVSLQLFGDARICRRTLELAFSELLPNGLVPGVVPCPTSRETEDWLALPAGNLFLIPVVYQYLLFTGDDETVRTYLPKLKGILRSIETYRDQSDLIAPPKRHWSFMDWSYEINGHSLNGRASAPINYLYLLCRKTLGELQALIGNEEESRKIFEEVRLEIPALEEAFFDPDRQRLIDFGVGSGEALTSQLTHALAALLGATSEERQRLFVEGIDDADLLAPELFLHTFVFDALDAAGLARSGVDRIRKYWSKIARQSSTIWEFGVHAEGKAALGGLGSLCHGFSTAPVSFLQKAILGVRPLEPGFRKFLFSPADCDLERAEGEIPTPSGKIIVKWVKKDSAFHATLCVPQGCQALVGGDRVFTAGLYDLCIEAAF